jgi:hypothetical protein
MKQLIKDQCERNKKELIYISGRIPNETFGIEEKALDKITQQTAEAVLSAVREMVKEHDGLIDRDYLLTQLQDNK